jgi:sugar phosphate isomerase/epimerase
MATIPLSGCDHSFPLLTPEEALAAVALLGVEGVDVTVFGGGPHLRPRDVREDPRRRAEELAEQIAIAGLRPADVFLIAAEGFATLAPNSPDPDVRAEARSVFEAVLEFAAGLGSPGLSTLPGVAWPEEDHADSLARAAAEMSWRVERAAAAGLRFSVEAHVGSVCATPELALELLAAAPGLELTLDYTHFTVQGIAQERIDPLLPHARHLHVRGGRRGRLQCPLRESEIDHAALAHRVLGADYEGFVALEYLWTDWEGLTDCDVVSESVLVRDLLRERLGAAA